MKPAYYDTAYLLKLQVVENGTHEIRNHASTVSEIHTFGITPRNLIP